MTEPADRPAATAETAPKEVAPALGTMERIKVINQIRKWGHHFDGKDPIAFLERTEELRLSYGLEANQLLLGLPELLRGDALLWYRNLAGSWSTWSEFCSQLRAAYLPPGYQRQLRREVIGRLQRQGETFQAYNTVIRTLARRAGGFQERELVEQVYENMLPEYQLYVPLTEGTTLAELGTKATQFEQIHQRMQSKAASKGSASPSAAATATAAYNRDECCWQCKQRRHTRTDCKRLPKKFCSRCGKDGVLTRDCHPPAGNASRAGDSVASVRPEAE